MGRGASSPPTNKEAAVGLSRKRKKELRKLQDSANKVWQTQQVLVGEAAGIAREASRQLGNYSREQVGPAVQATYDQRVAPVVHKSAAVSRDVLQHRVVPAVGGVVGSSLSVWDAANDTRSRLASGRGFALPDAKSFGKKADSYSKKATKAMSKKLAVLDHETPLPVDLSDLRLGEWQIDEVRQLFTALEFKCFQARTKRSQGQRARAFRGTGFAERPIEFQPF